MKRVLLRAYGKINLSIDVLGRLDNGYHQVEMVMQQIQLHDLVEVVWDEASNSGIHISLSTNRFYLPIDNRNLAYKAAEVMTEIYGQGRSGDIRIAIKKSIPVAAGLAGGSSNAAAVVLALNELWNLNEDLEHLCKIGGQLGADVPFCMMGQARCNKFLGEKITTHPMAVSCALATGIGTELKPLKSGLNSFLVLTKPPVSVSTAEIYKAIDSETIKEHPDTEALINSLEAKGTSIYEKNKVIEKNMFNVLEKVTYKRYPIVVYTKNKIAKQLVGKKILMSGSGPTLFALTDSEEEAKKVRQSLRNDIKETFWTRTTL